MKDFGLEEREREREPLQLWLTMVANSQRENLGFAFERERWKRR